MARVQMMASRPPAAPRRWPVMDFVELTADGHLLASAKYDSLEKLDWDSNVVWSAPIAPHHDLDLDDDGRIYVLTENRRKLSRIGRSYLIRDNDIVILSPDGKEERRIQLWQLLSRFLTEKRLKRFDSKRRSRKPKKNHYGDLFHTDSIDLLRRDIPGVGKQGNALISVREQIGRASCRERV